MLKTEFQSLEDSNFIPYWLRGKSCSQNCTHFGLVPVSTFTHFSQVNLLEKQNTYIIFSVTQMLI